MKPTLENALRNGESCELFELDTTAKIVGFDDTRLKFVDVSQEHGVAARVVADGKLAQGYVTKVKELESLVRRVSANTKLCDEVSFTFAPAADFPALELARPEVIAYSFEEMIRSGEQVVKIIKDYDPAIKTTFSISTTTNSVRVMNTNGVDVSYKKAMASYGMVGQLIQPNNIIQLLKGSKGLGLPQDPTVLARELVSDMALAKRTVPFSTGSYPIIFTPEALGDIFMAFVGAVSGDYVAKGMSPLVGKLGDRVLDERITILDDPLHPEGTFSAPTDDEGTPCKTKTVIEQGVLKTWLADRRSAAEMGIEPTGNGLRNTAFEKTKSFTVGVHTDFTNLMMKPGTAQYQKMIEQIDVGLEVHYITGILLGNLINGDFSGNLEVAFKIVDGHKVGRVKDVMIAGNFFDLFSNNIRAIGDTGFWTGSFGGGSGSLYLPHIALDRVEVSARE